jgi:hypothetical protein
MHPKTDRFVSMSTCELLNVPRDDLVDCSRGARRRPRIDLESQLCLQRDQVAFPVGDRDLHATGVFDGELDRLSRSIRQQELDLGWVRTHEGCSDQEAGPRIFERVSELDVCVAVFVGLFGSEVLPLEAVVNEQFDVHTRCGNSRRVDDLDFDRAAVPIDRFVERGGRRGLLSL